jgi:hypothetical protein
MYEVSYGQSKCDAEAERTARLRNDGNLPTAELTYSVIKAPLTRRDRAGPAPRFRPSACRAPAGRTKRSGAIGRLAFGDQGSALDPGLGLRWCPVCRRPGRSRDGTWPLVKDRSSGGALHP